MIKLYALVGIIINVVVVVVGGQFVTLAEKYWGQFLVGQSFPTVSIFVMGHYAPATFIPVIMIILFLVLSVRRSADRLFILLSNVTHVVTISILAILLYALAARPYAWGTPRVPGQKDVLTNSGRDAGYDSK